MRVRRPVGAPEELAQDPLLDVIELPDARCQSLGEALVDVGVLSELSHLFNPPIREHASPVAYILLFGRGLPGAQRRARRLGVLSPRGQSVVDYVQVGLVDRADGSLARAHALRDGTEDTRHLYTVTRADSIHEIVECEQDNGLGRLALGNLVWRLLQPHHLLVREEAAIMHHLHGHFRGTILAGGGLVDAASINHHFGTTVAKDTPEVPLLEVRDHRAHASYHARDGDQLIDVAGVQIPKAVLHLEVEGSDLDPLPP